MPVLSYMDNIFKLSHCFVNRDYSSIRDEILSMKEELNYRYEEGGAMAGIESIKQKILRLDAGSFQNLCDAYLCKIGYPNIVSLPQNFT